MISRCGLKPVFLSVCLAVGALTLPGCASAPIDMRGASDAEADVGQVELRRAANTLADRLDEAGWTVSATPAQATRSFFDRLISGENEESETSPDAVMIYLAADDAPLERLQADMTALAGDAADIASQALRVASSDQGLEAQGLARDLEAVERSLGAVRRATRFFEAVAEQGEFDGLETELEAVRAAQTRLGAATDALAERRWAARSGLFS